MPLWLLTVTALSLYISVVASIHYRFSVIFYLLSTSPIYKDFKKQDIPFFKFLSIVFQISNKSCQCIALQRCRVGTMLQLALSHNASAQ
jgi:hypothetical protein